MQTARQAVSDFVSGDGKHKTSVNESSAPAVTDEHVRPHRHENTTTAVDREIHQDHHHTTVQPITHRETLPEKHTHNMLPTEHRTFEHNNDAETRDKLQTEAAKFNNSTVTHDTTHSSNVAPTVEGERVHHHVHEHVQPLIQKDTIQPNVVHTTVPIHETHHAPAVHHGTSILPPKTLDEFTSSNNSSGTDGQQPRNALAGSGNALLGEYDGCPRPYRENLQTEQLDADKNSHHKLKGLGHDGHGGQGDLSNSGLNGIGTIHNMGNEREHNVNNGDRNSDVSSPMTTTSASASATGSGHKPSLLDKLNPKKDADGDGKAGFLS